MKKIILSATTVILFGMYSVFIKSGDISTQLYKSNPVAVNTENGSTADAIGAGKKSDCVFIPSQDNEGTEGRVTDNETGEVKTKYGYYKCTTITVATPPASIQTPTTKTPTPVAVTPPPVTKPKSNTIWKDGTYIGDSVDAYYGQVQVSVTTSKDRIVSVSFLDYPQDRRTSLQKSDYAMPILKSEVISAQNAHVDTVSGVTYTSEAFIRSLSGALAQAKI